MLRANCHSEDPSLLVAQCHDMPTSRLSHRLLRCLLKVIHTFGLPEGVLSRLGTREHAILWRTSTYTSKGAHSSSSALGKLLHYVRLEGHLAGWRLLLYINSPAWLVVIGKLLLVVVVINLGKRLRLHVIVYLIVTSAKATCIVAAVGAQK